MNSSKEMRHRWRKEEKEREEEKGKGNGKNIFCVKNHSCENYYVCVSTECMGPTSARVRVYLHEEPRQV